MAYDYDMYEYSQKLRLYNSEGRENVGASTVWTAEEDQYWDFRGATTGTYTFNATGTLPTTELPLCSFKNGNVIKFRVTNYTPAGGLDDPYYCNFAVNYYDKNGTVIKSTYVNNIPFDSRLNDPDTTQFMYSPPGLYYQLGVDDHPTGFISGGTIYTISKHGLVPGNMPELKNNIVKVNGLNGAGDWYSQSQVALGFQDLDEFMETLGKDPTPKKPEDDTNDPDPDDPKPDPDYTDPSDDVPDPDLPTGGDAIATGLVHVYAPTSGQLRNLAIKLWDDDPTAFVNVIAKIHNDPMEAIISLHTVPYQLVGTNKNCVIGNYDSGIVMPSISQQWFKINLGSIYLPEKWGSALDYAPYNDIQIFLPYIGIRSLQIDDVVGKTISVVYNTDVLTGCTVAHIKCGNSVLYSYNTILSSEIPLSMSSYAPLYRTVANGIVNVASQAAAGNAAGMAAAAAGAAINVALSKQTNVSRSGSIGACFGSMSHLYPYLIIHRPIQSLASGFRHFKGYPSNITTSLGSISGYTEIESIHLDGIACTEAERDEIRALLYNGVIF